MSIEVARRDFVKATLAVTAGAVISGRSHVADAQDDPYATYEPLPVPDSGEIQVGFALSPRANVIDTASAWEVFQDVSIERDGRRVRPFRLFTIGPSGEIIRMTGGLQVKPDYTYATAPMPQVVCVPAQSGTKEVTAFLQRAGQEADMVMSICTGAFQLGVAGLLDGKNATTHHDFFDTFEKRFPNANLIRGRRFVDNGRIATAGGLTSGFDMALHVVERYFGRETALQTADYMEYTHYAGLVTPG